MKKDPEGGLAQGFILKDRYKIVKSMGEGTISNLYLAEDMVKKIHWVIKELKNVFSSPVESKNAISQFEFEANLLINLRHHQLPRLEEYFEYDRKYYIVMEYVVGDELGTIVEDSNKDDLNELRVIDWGIKLCRVLNYLHSQKPQPIIFRALKPENIIVTDDNNLKLIDFGISKIFDPSTKTVSIAKSVNPHFSPFEQYSTRLTDERTDIYSLGAVLYYSITRTLPVDAVDRTINNLPLKDPKNFNKNISKEFNDVIVKAMSLEKTDRYQSATEMKADLDRIYNKLAGISGDAKKSLKTNLFPSALSENTEKCKKEVNIEIPSDKIETKKINKKNKLMIFVNIFALLLILSVIFILSSSLYNKFICKPKFFIVCNCDKKEELSKLLSLLKSRGQQPVFEEKPGEEILEKGYVLTSKFKSGEEDFKYRELIGKAGYKYENYCLKNDFYLVLSNKFNNQKDAEVFLEKLKQKGIKVFQVTPYNFSLEGNMIYSVKVLIQEKDRKNIEQLLISSGYKPIVTSLSE